MNSKELLYSIREWAPLEVVERIPRTYSRGLFTLDLNITCIDAVDDFIALASDAGIVFWYNRQSGNIQKLKAETSTCITCVKIVNTVEYMVAAGNSAGQVNIFQIQKELPADLNLMAPCTRQKPIERYTVRDLHQCAITCCEWSKNGMKLFTGDRQGIVVLTELDYQAHLSKSVEILSEAYEIVQLSAHLGYLLVSSLYRSIICQKKKPPSREWEVIQIGKKDRKQLADCGGTFFKHSSSNENRLRLICGRPNLRFWIADNEGNVEKTLLFREAIEKSPTWEIPMLNPKYSINLQNSFINSHILMNQTRPKEPQPVAVADESKCFHRIFFYNGQDSLIVTHDELKLYVLNLEHLRVEAVAKGFRKIKDFCVCNEEIFVLEGNRSVLRLGPGPEKPNKTAKIIYNPLMPHPVPHITTAQCAASFEAPQECQPDGEPTPPANINNAEECFELPPIEQLNLSIPIELAVESSKGVQNRRLEVLNEISDLDFDDNILQKSTRKKRRKSQDAQQSLDKKKHGGIIEIGQVVKCQDALPQKPEYTVEAITMEASFCRNDNERNPDDLNLTESYRQHLPDLISPTTLKQTIAEKAKTLAKELNLPEVCLQPITDEELRISKYLAQQPSQPTTSKNAIASSLFDNLEKIYPGSEQGLKDSGIQTMPQKKNYYIEEHLNGLPIEDMCQSLMTTNILDNDLHQEAQNDEDTKQTRKSLQFISTKPKTNENEDEINSFLLDFNKAKDPLAKINVAAAVAVSSKNKGPATASSEHSSNGSSSEWEFLDN